METIDRNAGIKFTHGAILRFFAPQGRHVPLINAKFGTSAEIKILYTPYQISRRSVHIWAFPTQKLQKSRILQTYS